MNKTQVCKLTQYGSNTALKNAELKFKTYCTIRRDLRMANDICNHTIGLHEKIKIDDHAFQETASTLFIVRASVMHAIILYTRWFKSTQGKTSLKPQKYFGGNSQKLSVHKKLIEMRDKYIAHNQLDLLGSDRVWVNTDDCGRFVSSESDFLESAWLQDDSLNMSTFRECVHLVHNKIDSDVIPRLWGELDEQLKVALGSQT